MKCYNSDNARAVKMVSERRAVPWKNMINISILKQKKIVPVFSVLGNYSVYIK